MLAAQQPIDMPRFLIEALTITHSRKIGLVAVTIHLASPPTVPAGLPDSDYVAMCSLAVAAMALILSIITAAIQIRHNILAARPHLDIDLAAESCLLSITNHGPGTARLRSLAATIDNRSFNLLVETELNDFCQWLSNKLQSDINLQRTILNDRTSFGPNHTIKVIRISSALSSEAANLLERILIQLSIDVSYASIFKKVYTEHFGPSQRNAP